MRGELRDRDSVAEVRGEEVAGEAQDSKRCAGGADGADTRTVHQEGTHSFSVQPAAGPRLSLWFVLFDDYFMLPYKLISCQSYSLWDYWLNRKVHEY